MNEKLIKKADNLFKAANAYLKEYIKYDKSNNDGVVFIEHENGQVITISMDYLHLKKFIETVPKNVKKLKDITRR